MSQGHVDPSFAKRARACYLKRSMVDRLVEHQPRPALFRHHLVHLLAILQPGFILLHVLRKAQIDVFRVVQQCQVVHLVQSCVLE